MTKQKVIIVSNRLPVSVSKVDGKLVFTPSSGGLATAMSSLNGDTGERLWIGWPGISSDDLTPAEKGAITRKLRSYGCVPVFLNAEQLKNFYSGYANDTIWPLFHYFQSFAQYNSAYWDGYKEVNNIFKKAVIKSADPRSLIWVHDYHLMVLPQQLRAALPQTTIGFFMHIPFPSYEIFRSLPNRHEILEGLLGADLVGFHVYDYARHFLSSTLRILGLNSSHGSIIMNDRLIKVDAFPIGVDYQKFVNALQEEKTLQEIKTLSEHYKGQKLILSVDRLDYSKGIMKRLEAFHQFLKQNPKYIKKVVLLVVAVPSRVEVGKYKELRDDIEQAIGRINGAHGTVDWTPISYQFKNLPFEQIVALYAKADVALITPLRDGMNLVAKEYVASKQTNTGVLVLSEMAGAVDELPEAIRINPNDTDALVDAIKTALRMPKKERIDRMRSMQSRLSRYTVQRWAADFMSELRSTSLDHAQQNSKMLVSEMEDKIVRLFKAAKRRLLLLDYDGTLRGFVSTHAQAPPPKSLIKLMQDLTNLPGVQLSIVSGRKRENLESWFGDMPVALAAEHGGWMKYAGEWSQQQVSLREQKRAIMPILEHYTDRTPGSSIEEKDFAVVWHYRDAPTELAHARAANLRSELNRLLAKSEIGVHIGSKVIEIKPRTVQKGAVAEDLRAMYNPDFILCIGDDYTDEDMFRALPEKAISIKVGLGETHARYQVISVQKVLQLLRKLL